MSLQHFDILVKTIDEQVLEFPMSVTFNCEQIRAIGMSQVRAFDEGYCINVLNIYKFRQGQTVFGSQQFKSDDDFSNFVNSQCAPCGGVCCTISYKGCFLTYKGKILKYERV